ncbi:hypothetical protein [Tellurirhabdus rosea]|uniref:hypothetical protein n=1 Tax=Tellurirhabdus rosea TaxID=2674997 RepID=UPI00224CADD5|nr:hypothetical protein [Tellurirhabdus rosea]
MKRLLLATGLWVLLSSGLLAQTEPIGRRKNFYLHSALNLHITDVNELNAELVRAGHLPFDGIQVGRGGGFYTLFPKVRLASLFNFSTYSKIKSGQNRTNWIRATQAGTSLGLLVRNSEHLQLIPYAGVLYSWLGVRVASAQPVPGSTAGYLSGPSNQHHMRSNQFMGNLGIHLARTGFGRTALGQRLMAGVRVGYFVPIGANQWKTGLTTLSDGPDTNAGGFYTSLVVGLAQ